MAWTDWSGYFGYGTKLTSTQMSNVRGNVEHIFNFVNSGSLTDHGILLGSGTGAITPTAVMTNGQLLVGQTGADPAPKTISGDITVDEDGVASIGSAKVDEANLASNSVSQAKMQDDSVGQAELKISNGGGTIGQSTATVVTLTGGLYSFWYQQKSDIASDVNCSLGAGCTTSFATQIYKSSGSGYTYWHWRNAYVTASGEVYWIFILRDKSTGEICAVWLGDDHPCMGNGGKPKLMPHPWGNVDEEKYEIIVINPTQEEMDEMRLACEVDDELEPDKHVSQVIIEQYEIDDESEPEWPTKAVTVGLPKTIEVEIDGQMVKQPVDWKAIPAGTKVTPIKKVIPKPDNVSCRKLKKKG